MQQPLQNLELSETLFRRYLAKYAAIGLFPALVFLLFIQPSPTCVGWQCSARAALIGSSWVTRGYLSSSVVDVVYIVLQAVICFVLTTLAVRLVLMLLSKKDVVRPLINLCLALLILFGSNYLTALSLRTASPGAISVSASFTQ